MRFRVTVRISIKHSINIASLEMDMLFHIVKVKRKNESTTPVRQNLIIQLVNISPGHPSFKRRGNVSALPEIFIWLE
jgi:hypothetical protein